MSTTGRRGPTPTTEDITGSAAELATAEDRFAFGYGWLAASVAVFADEHATCTRAHCRTCAHLRHALATIAAIEGVRP